MGIAERKAREKEELKDIILQGAKKLFVEKGIAQTTIRNIADAINYSIGTVYVYFKDKNDILHQLHTLGFIQLGSEMQILYSVTEPMERLKALGRVYINFAFKNPDMYNLMFSLRAPMDFLVETKSDDWHEGQGAFGVLKNTVKECLDSGYFKGHTLNPLTFLIWSTVHGMCSLYIGDRIKGVNLGEPEDIVKHAYQEFLIMIDRK
jgi:AcrR family transcriptional regulator